MGNRMLLQLFTLCLIKFGSSFEEQVKKNYFNWNARLKLLKILDVLYQHEYEAKGTRANFSWNCNKNSNLLQFHEVSPSINFFVSQHFSPKKCCSNKNKNSNRFEFIFLSLQHFFGEKCCETKIYVKKNVSP